MTKEKPGVREDGAWLEARISIGGVELTFAEAMSLRVAIATFDTERALPQYQPHIARIGQLIAESAERDGIVEPGR